ncbi:MULTISPECIES: anthranilate synthase component II [unclassified Arsukibacterium]|uniref:anthranilate synthase component II n=1 Tax=unclassified Arsukibacterium TaxID=2635278 RepID=UPI000C54C5D6|nr:MULTISPECIES: aminodeoxychorismate/anthranilate synthase component II [unclassified Arsukibacterium]MAA96013.1 anthranilate/aminodeoxychorismate synthase component II [Rheinheimera sp.]MBM34308.1 anthranilate/aminodeoxychorismate synthase component II [Rheinheimera sp.]HAW92304.1 anthranilate/aminodeoxychorismate synthase component II [Candidatus Azambacteria bacterium]|tara:strand:- start:100 stop:714 length:615 start_codon:yes stop_codon:yes gene_type:complete
MLLMIDNYDSFTWNLVQYFAELGQQVLVKRNDEISVAQMAALKPAYVVISPGPGTPDDAGVSLAAIEYFAGKVPLLGVCLGHQAIAQVFGGQVCRAAKVMHGKNSDIYHQGQSVFAGLPSPLAVTRYHSLLVAANSLPAELVTTAWTNEPDQPAEIMGLMHNKMAIHGVQFHPEAILSDSGKAILNNFLQQPGAVSTGTLVTSR